MPRRPRIFIPGHPVHVIQRGNNRGQVFFGGEDGKKYLDWLAAAATQHGLAIHAYVLMSNHIHLLASPENSQSLPRAMRDVNWHYSRYVNTTQQRTGTLWEGRYRASLLDSDSYFFSCSRYIELNPVRAGMAATPGAYRWSSYRHNGEAKADPVITPHALYTALGETSEARAEAYRALFEGALADKTLDDIRGAVNSGRPLGSDSFAAFVERHGRPTKRR
jgi:putative transposase